MFSGRGEREGGLIYQRASVGKSSWFAQLIQETTLASCSNDPSSPNSLLLFESLARYCVFVFRAIDKHHTYHMKSKNKSIIFKCTTYRHNGHGLRDLDARTCEPGYLPFAQGESLQVRG